MASRSVIKLVTYRKHEAYFQKDVLERIDDVLKENKKLKTDLHDTQTNCDLEKKERINYQREARKNQRKAEALSDENKDLKKQVEKNKNIAQELRQARLEIADLKWQINQKDKKIASLENLREENEELKAENKVLEKQVKRYRCQNSSNSNYPSSLDVGTHSRSSSDYSPQKAEAGVMENRQGDSAITGADTAENIKRIPTSSRKPSGKPKGGQSGHNPHNIKPDWSSESASIVFTSTLPSGGERFIDESGRLCVRIQERSMEMKVRNTNTIYCYSQDADPLPECVLKKFKVNSVSYSDSFKSGVLYTLLTGGMTLRGLSEIIKQHSHGEICLSPATISNWQKELFVKSSTKRSQILDELLQEPVLHVDETSIKIAGKRYWVHCLAGEKAVVFFCTADRGGKEEGPVAILNERGYRGTVVHDHFSAYEKLIQVTHGECNVHILRYMRGGAEFDNCDPCLQMIDLYYRMLSRKSELQGEGKDKIGKREFNRFEKEFILICDAGIKCWEDQLAASPGLVKYTPPYYTTFWRMKNEPERYLLFLSDFSVPFGNNRAEQLIAAVKARMKRSKQFNSRDGAEACMAELTLQQTAKSNGDDVMDLFLACFDVQN